MAIRFAFAGLAVVAMAMPAVGQEFAFTQTCTLALEACDMLRDGSEFCPTGQEIKVDFWAEGDSFNLRVSGGDETGFGKGTPHFSLGQGYFTENLRLYYILWKNELDGVFWISVPDGASGAQLNWGGQEDYFRGSCVPLE